MSTSGKIFTWIGVILSIAGVAITWGLHWLLGLSTTIIVIAAYFYWKRLKTQGFGYLRDFADKTGLTYIEDSISYGEVEGTYHGYGVHVKVSSDYNSDLGLAGFVLTDVLFNSAIGVVEGISNLTVVSLVHGKHVDEPYRVDDRTFVGRKAILYTPPVGDASGLPSISPLALQQHLDELVKIADEITA